MVTSAWPPNHNFLATTLDPPLVGLHPLDQIGVPEAHQARPPTAPLKDEAKELPLRLVGDAGDDSGVKKVVILSKPPSRGGSR